MKSPCRIGRAPNASDRSLRFLARDELPPPVSLRHVEFHFAASEPVFQTVRLPFEAVGKPLEVETVGRLAMRFFRRHVFLIQIPARVRSRRFLRLPPPVYGERGGGVGGRLRDARPGGLRGAKMPIDPGP